jgi:protein gp37
VGERTGIEWTDHTWSPWWGCQKVSEACTHCYAETLADRWRPEERLWRGNRARVKDWTKPLAWNRKAERDGVQRRIFPSMCDPFDAHPDVLGWRADVSSEHEVRQP